MRIAIVTDYYYPALGGITEHVHGQALSLHERGHQVTVITGHLFRPPKVVDDAFNPEPHVPFEVIRMGQALRSYGNGGQTLHTIHPRMFGKLKALFRARKFDVIHTHAPYNPSFVQVVPFVAPRGSATIGTFHSVFSPGLLINTFARALRPSIARLDGRIAVSKACIDSCKPYFPFDYTVIPNGIDENHFSPDANPFPQFSDGRKNILFVGRFDQRNGLETMIQAFTIVRRAKGDAVRLIIVGDGPLRAYYARNVPNDVAESVVWVGRVNSTRPRYYVSADILCTPCDRASFGMVLLEAMSCGVPVVASRISGFQLVMEHQRQGLMIPDTKDANAFAEALIRLLDAPDERARMGREGRRTAVEHYSWTSVAARLEDYYLRVIEGRQSP
jgi:phosphatidyl-myo-inositol alpha-mannosyltransferase